MEFLMFVGTAYAVLYVMWLLVAIVSGVADRWINITLFFAIVPFFIVFGAIMVVFSAFISPFVLYFSAKARQEFRDKMREQGL